MTNFSFVRFSGYTYMGDSLAVVRARESVGRVLSLV